MDVDPESLLLHAKHVLLHEAAVAEWAKLPAHLKDELFNEPPTMEALYDRCFEQLDPPSYRQTLLEAATHLPDLTVRAVNEHIRRGLEERAESEFHSLHALICKEMLHCPAVSDYGDHLESYIKALPPSALASWNKVVGSMHAAHTQLLELRGYVWTSEQLEAMISNHCAIIADPGKLGRVVFVNTQRPELRDVVDSLMFSDYIGRYEDRSTELQPLTEKPWARCVGEADEETRGIYSLFCRPLLHDLLTDDADHYDFGEQGGDENNPSLLTVAQVLAELGDYSKAHHVLLPLPVLKQKPMESSPNSSDMEDEEDA